MSLKARRSKGGQNSNRKERGERDSTTEIFEIQLANDAYRSKDCIV